ncbi:MAG: MBL fold metallo-hydrolase, partial [Anaerolineae bacterium]
PDEIGLILITHGHTDHFGSAAVLRERLAAPVAVHAADADALRRGIQQPGSLNPTHWLWKLLSGAFSATSRGTPPVEPDIVFEEAWRLDEYGVAGEVMPTPGHTPGSVSVILDSGEIIVGDMMGRDFLSLRRRAGPPFVAWDLDRNFRSLREVLARHPHTIYVTHGGAFSPEDAAHLV